MTTAPPRPWRVVARAWLPPLLIVLAAMFAWRWSGAGSGDAVLPGAAERTAAVLRSFASPDLSVQTLQWCGALAIETAAVALWGTAIGAFAGLGLALLASDRLAAASRIGLRPRATTRIRVEFVRTGLDALRAIPDFAWALLTLVFVGPGPVTGAIAIAISVTGLLGKIYSQLLDAAPPEATQTIDGTGASTLTRALWGHLVVNAGPLLSYTLLRLECSLRNASVIGIVGGGGLGAALFEELGFARYDRVATVLITLLLLTAGADRGAKALLARLRRREGTGTHSTRRRMFAGLAVALLGAAIVLGPAARAAVVELSRIDLEFLRQSAATITELDLGADRLTALASDTLVVVAIALLATLGAGLGAVGLGWLIPRHPDPLGRGGRRRPLHHALVAAADTVALVARAIPDVVWLLLLGIALRTGVLAAILAILVHSFGLLARLCAEAIDDAPAPARHTSAAAIVGFGWLVWPRISATMTTHIALSAETNLRAGLVAGIVGAGGLGDAFHSAVSFWRLGDAALAAVAMVLTTIAVDRAARRLTGASPRVRRAAVRTDDR